MSNGLVRFLNYCFKKSAMKIIWGIITIKYIVYAYTLFRLQHWPTRGVENVSLSNGSKISSHKR